MEQNKQFIYTKRPEKEVTEEHYKLITTEIPSIKEDEILIKAKYISVDPYMRIQQSSLNTWEQPHPLNKVQGSNVVGEILQLGSANLKDGYGNTLSVGDTVNCYTGWQLYGVALASKVRKLMPEYYDGLPFSFGIGVLGMPGLTAYFGFLETGKPKEGETVVVSGAAGAVGSIVVQIAKIKGCKVVAFAGSEDKVAYLRELGADVALNYKNYSTAKEAKEALQVACPNGIDIYFDNTGGIITDAVFELINVRARIIICGQISQYNGGLDQPEMGPRFLHRILYTRATIQGILSRDYNDRYPEMLATMSGWIREKKIQFNVTEFQGFESLPKALNSLFQGKNTGKLVVKI